MNERDSVGELHREVRKVLEKTALTWELLFVDDGSTDGTAEVLSEIAHEAPEVRVITLARNYGQTAAMQAGFDHAGGELIAVLDGDLQNDPACIPERIELLEKEQADVVSGWRKNRHDQATRVILSKLANRLISHLTKTELHDFGCSLKIYRRDMIEQIRIFGELHRFLPAILTEVGAKVIEVPVPHRPRVHGESKYKLDRAVRVALDLLLIMFFRRYITRPMHFFGGLGLATMIPGLAICAYLSIWKLVTNGAIGERPLLALGIMLVLIGTILISQGLLGEMVARFMHEVGERPQYRLKLLRKNGSSPAAKGRTSAS